jgi:hypothetical protein
MPLVHGVEATPIGLVAELPLARFGWGVVNSGGSLTFILGAVLCTVLVGFAALWTLPTVGRPVLIVTRDGVQPAGYGVLPWSAIQGIDLTEIRHRYGKSGHLLHLYVPDLRERLTGAHGLIRLMHSLVRTWRFSTRVMVRRATHRNMPS